MTASVLAGVEMGTASSPRPANTRCAPAIAFDPVSPARWFDGWKIAKATVMERALDHRPAADHRSLVRVRGY